MVLNQEREKKIIDKIHQGTQSVNLREMKLDECKNLVYMTLDRSLSFNPELLKWCPNLKQLTLSGNYPIWPMGIFELIKLEVLQIIDNTFNNLPDEIGNLINLKVLDLNDNKLSILPKEIGNLIRLEILQIINNQLSILPKEIGNLYNLKTLNLNNNLLTTIPREIGKLTALKNLEIENNKIRLPKTSKYPIKYFQERIKKTIRFNQPMIWNNQLLWEDKKMLISLRSIQLLLKYFDGIDKAVSARLIRKRPWLEPALTQLLCGLMDTEEQKEEKLDYTIDQLNKDLAEQQDEIISVTLDIQTHEYPSNIERWVTQADLGIIISYDNHINPKDSWEIPWILQAKKLFSNRLNKIPTYTEKSKFSSKNIDQEKRMNLLSRIIGPYINYILYCPRPSNLDENLKTKLAMNRRKAIVDSEFAFETILQLRDDLLSPDPTTAAGIFIAPLHTCPDNLGDVHSRISPIWDFEGTCPFSWLFLSHFLISNDETLLHERIGKYKSREMALGIARGDMSIIDKVIKDIENIELINNEKDDQNKIFEFLPPHTLSISIHSGQHSNEKFNHSHND